MLENNLNKMYFNRSLIGHFLLEANNFWSLRSCIFWLPIQNRWIMNIILKVIVVQIALWHLVYLCMDKHNYGIKVICLQLAMM